MAIFYKSQDIVGILFIAVKFLIRKNHIKLYSIYKNLELIIIDNSIKNKAIG